MTEERDANAALMPWEDRNGSADAGPSVVRLPVVATLVAVCVILYVARDLFLPLILGMLFAFILSPVVNALRRRGLADALAVILAVSAAATLVAAFLVFVGYQFSQIGARLPQYQGNVIAKIDALLETGKDYPAIIHLQGMLDTIAGRLQLDEPAAPAEPDIPRVEVVERSNLWDWLVNVILPALTPVALFRVIAVIVFFTLLERASLRDRLVQLIGGTNIVVTSRLLAEAGDRVSSYLFAQLVLNVIYAVPIWLGLWLIGVPNALLFGLITMVLRFVPYLGSAISALLPLAMAVAISPDWSAAGWTLALFAVVEAATSNLIEPWFYGQRTGISPLAVIVSAFFWTWLWGPMGLIIATPLTVCLVVLGEHVPALRLFPILFGDKPPLSASAQLYDRLLTGNFRAFSEAATAAAAEGGLMQFYDQTAIPALARAQADHQAGLLPDHQARRIAFAALRLARDLQSLGDENGGSARSHPSADIGPAREHGRLVAVIGAQTALDDAAAAMLAGIMQAKGARAQVLPHDRAPALTGKPAVLVVVTLDPAPGPSLDRRWRGLRRQLPETRLGVAMWSSQDTTGFEDGAVAPLVTGPWDFVTFGIAGTLAACVFEVEAET